MTDSAPRRLKPPLDFDEVPELSDDRLARSRPVSDVQGAERAGRMLRRRGRSAKPEHERKQQVTVRLSPDLLEALRAPGDGWQTRLDEIFARQAPARYPEPDIGAACRSETRLNQAAGGEGAPCSTRSRTRGS